MKGIMVAVALFLFMGACVAQVHELTSKNFNQLVLQSGDYWLVEFYAPWCGHCKKLEPEWKAAAKQLKSKAKLGAVDCTKHEELAQQFGITGFPTIKEFGKDKKKPQEYRGGRQASDIVQYVQSSPHAGLADTVALLTYTDMYAFFDSKLPSVLVMGRNKNKKGNPRWLEELSQLHQSKVAKHFGFTDRPLVLVAQGTQYAWTKLTRAERIKEDVQAFIKQSLKALVNPSPIPSFPPPEDTSPKKKPPIALHQIDESTFEQACLEKSSTLSVVCIPPSSASASSLDLKAVAKQFRRDPLAFFSVDAQNTKFISRLHVWLELPQSETDRCIVFKRGRQIRIADVDNIQDTAKLEKFLSQVLDGLQTFRPVTTPFNYEHTEL
ncbi:hypothetical protein Ae201684P_006799 [Aphanomyces euteiches]|nr:hypothetical protein Ae201684P_006799 [Aphanomyces euteiches]